MKKHYVNCSGLLLDTLPNVKKSQKSFSFKCPLKLTRAAPEYQNFFSSFTGDRERH